MTPKEAKEKQERLAVHFDLGHWYGVKCEKCHGVFPKLMKTDTVRDKCYYICEVCGRKTGLHEMPWQAREEWNHMDVQLSLFDFLGE